MTVTPQTLPKRELIGLSAEVIQSTNRSLVGIKGIVTAETRGMLELGTKKVPKRGTRFMFTL
ncbi:MAG: ribonuclease P protein subunit, partial [Candidatus Aenigmatarchaeota archaeon]